MFRIELRPRGARSLFRRAARLLLIASAPLTVAALAAPAQAAGQLSSPGNVAPQGGAPVFAEDPVRVAVEQFLQRETAGLPGKTSIQVIPPSGGRARECVSPEPFLPPSAQLQGRVSVGVRCGGDRPWTRYVQARISVLGDYYVASRTLAPGEPITAADIEVRQGDLASLPRAVVTDPGQVEGAVAGNRIGAGSPLRSDLLRKAIAVRRNQTVAVTVEGQAFQIRSEGKALTDGAPGSSVQVRLENGQVVNGVVKDADTVVLR
ncbi:flagellar basal body P-ring formation chaperone FlgA [Cupriavidus sp. AU9028]|uniref:flagellar basal body P-ring formation chaperone FlgA n=1 Tax=Cupriavidus sp. AU9028 TaxID=2871157 RepID=UPI001C97E384|nr:flagellar basal body P-ring formation chaperone FlgA [Cupriavidus sp. AU9028]MBY4898450.1 flagellar basal body P-ring formation protein FlgA [Cupriavidus sp. AU9028]